MLATSAQDQDAKRPVLGSTFGRGGMTPVCLDSTRMNTGIDDEPRRPLRLLVADDHPVVRAGMVSLLGRECDLRVIFQASHGAEAVTGWQAHAPDVGLIDLSMPVLDGFDAVAAIRQIDPEARLVVMTTMCGDEDVYRALQTGASGYLLKDCSQQELVDCIRAVAIGRKYLHASASVRLAERIACEGLTARETDVLRWLAEGLSNKAIAQRLGVAAGTVKTHMKGLLGKLQVNSRTQAVRLALQRGLVRLPPDTLQPMPPDR
jgi:two-component system, NarL family, response regulator